MALDTPQDVVQYAHERLERAGNGIASMLNRAVRAGDQESIRDLHNVIGALSAVRDSLDLMLVRLDARKDNA